MKKKKEKGVKMKKEKKVLIGKIILVIIAIVFFIYFTNFAKHDSNSDWKLTIFFVLVILIGGAYNLPIIKK